MAKVLLIEDNPWLGELYEQLLGADHNVLWLRDAYDAMEAVDSFVPGVIVLDLLLPWSNGIQLLHELASYSDTSKIPVVLFSAALPDVDPDILRAYGVAAAIDKTSAKPREVINTINNIVAQQYARSA